MKPAPPSICSGRCATGRFPGSSTHNRSKCQECRLGRGSQGKYSRVTEGPACRPSQDGGASLTSRARGAVGGSLFVSCGPAPALRWAWVFGSPWRHVHSLACARLHTGALSCRRGGQAICAGRGPGGRGPDSGSSGWVVLASCAEVGGGEGIAGLRGEVSSRNPLTFVSRHETLKS